LLHTTDSSFHPFFSVSSVMSRSESDAESSSSASDSSDDEQDVSMSSSSSESESNSPSEGGSESDSGSDSDAVNDDALAKTIAAAAAAASKAVDAEREAKRLQRREANAKKKATKDAAAAVAAPATPARPASAPKAASTPAPAASPASAAKAACTLPSPSSLLNKLIKPLQPDFYYHLGLSSALPLKAMFGDVRFVILSGSPVRALETATKLQEALGVRVPTGCAIAPIGKTERYSLYKVGPVLSVSHGMGKPSISIMLHELTKLLAAAGVLDKTTYIRVGTSGGVGVEPGSVIVSSGTVDGTLQPFFPVVILGKTVLRPCVIRPELVSEILSVATPTGGSSPSYEVLSGVTLATDDFYEGQGRLDGAIAEYTLEDKMAFLARAHAAGIKNIEMESDAIVAFCTKLHIPCAVICCAIVNRLQGDQVLSTPAQLVQYTENAVTTAIRFIQHRLRLPKTGDAPAPGAGGKVKKALLHAQRDEAKIRAGGKAVPHVAGSCVDFLHSALTQPHTGAVKQHRASSSSAKKDKTERANSASNASSKKKNNKATPQTPTAAKSAPSTPAASSKKQKKSATPAAAATGTPAAAKTALSTPAASSKKGKNKKDKASAAPATPAAAAAPAAVAAPSTPAVQSAVKVLEVLEKGDAAKKSRKKKDATAAAPTPVANGTAAPMDVSTTPAPSEKKKREKKAKNANEAAPTPAAAAAAPATPAAKSDKTKKEPKPATPAAAAPAAAAAAPVAAAAADGAVGPNRREKKRLADEARAAEAKTAADKVAADALQAAAQRAADVAKFDPDAAAFPKVRRPNKKEREAERAKLAAAAAAGTPVKPSANGNANGNSTPAPAEAGKKRKHADSAANGATPAANGTAPAASAEDGRKEKKARKEKK
jgi:uridine phosphorylase